MIDLHCHVLPALDDGAADVGDSVAMMRQAQADGIELVCATPHIRHDHAVRIDELAERVAALNAALTQEGVTARVLPGGEVAETALAELSDTELRAVSLGGGRRWILLEPAPGPLGPSLVRAASALRERGFRALIAHPERHTGNGWVECLAEAVCRGALVQVTAAHLLDPATTATLTELAQRGLVHVVGSDAHSSRAGRPLAIAAGLSALARVPLLRTHRDWIAAAAPRAIIGGEDLRPPFALRS